MSRRSFVDKTVIDEKKRLSETVLWQLQRDFYKKSEVKCWQECVVPNFVTSNCFIAQAYARIITGFLRDHFGRRGSRKRTTQQPVYIIEIGAGSAKLSYVLLQKLLALAKYLPKLHQGGKQPSDMDSSGSPGQSTGVEKGSGGAEVEGHFCFKYVVTDFSHSNFGFWMNHPKFQELFSLGVVDFAVFDAEPGVGGGESGPEGGEGSSGACEGGEKKTRDGLWGRLGCLRLELSGEEIRPGDLEHPVIVVANYVFDTLKQDAFRVHNGSLEEVLCTTSSTSDLTAGMPLTPEHLRFIKCSWSSSPKPPSECYPNDPRLMKILETLERDHKEASFLMPVGAVQAVDRMRELVGEGKALVLVGDKGYLSSVDLEGRRDPHLAMHGSFSCMVNFHALHLLCEADGGSVVHSQHLDGFKCSAMAFGLDKTDYPQFCMACKGSMGTFSPDGFSSLQRLLKEESRGLSLKSALSLVRLSHHDPDVFYKFKQVFIEKGPYAGEKLQNDIRHDMMLVHRLYFPLQPSKDVAFEMGRIFMGLKDFESAADLFRRVLLVSQRYCGVHHVSWYNMGVCHYYLSQIDQAEKCFEESLQLCPDYPDAIKWREKLSNLKEALSAKLDGTGENLLGKSGKAVTNSQGER
ncbi:unnamed protein product [Discosporangium mesarthrocarpum]